jgi:RNA polymerase primary sigma factor
MHLEEIASIPVCGDIRILEQELKKANLAEREEPELYQKLLNLSLSRIVEIACEYTGYGVLLLDLIQEGSMGLWQYLPRLCGDDFEKMRDYVVRHVMKKLLIIQAHANGVGQKMRQAMEDYRSMDEKLLMELGRNPTIAEIAEALHMTEETASSVAGMIEAARMVSRAKAEPEPDPQEEERAVEDTAYFQMRQRIEELLTSLSETDAKLLTLRFGLQGGLPMSPEEAGRKLGLTPAEVVQREQAALAALRAQKN